MWVVRVFISGREDYKQNETELKLHSVHSPWVTMPSVLVIGIITQSHLGVFPLHSAVSKWKAWELKEQIYLASMSICYRKLRKYSLIYWKLKKNSLPNRCAVMSDEQRKGWTEALPSLRGERWGVATIRQAWTAADTNAHQQEIMFGAPREEKHKHCLMCQDWPPGPCWWCSGHQQWDVNMGQLSYFTWVKLYIVCVHIFNQRKNTWNSLACF